VRKTGERKEEGRKAGVRFKQEGGKKRKRLILRISALV
jgi:hypothetical protein